MKLCQWLGAFHVWDLCRCKMCGKIDQTRPSSLHDWHECRCRTCGRENHDFEQIAFTYSGGILSGSETRTLRCRKCLATKDETDAWDDRQAYGYPSNWTK